MSFRVWRTSSCLAIVLSLGLSAAVAQSSSSKKDTRAVPQHTPSGPARLALDTSETLFSVLTAINSCGYDQDLNSADPIRQQVRNQVAQAVQASMDAQDARERMCRFFRDKMQPDSSRELTQYVSLALNMTPPPQFALTGRAADLPPDAANVQEFIPLLQRFYDAVGLHRIWTKQTYAYEQKIKAMQEPVNQMLLKTDLYLKNPLSSYLGRQFVVYVEPMGAPSEINARNYGEDYFMVITPGQRPLNTDKLRHTYLHFILDSITLKRGTVLKKLEPLLESVRTAPVDASYKHDITLMTTESLIRAIEARNFGIGSGLDARTLEQKRAEQADAAMKEGFILTQHFYEQLVAFEKEPTALRDALSDMLYAIQLDRERKRAENITFARQTSADPLTKIRREPSLLDLAEDRLASNDPEAAHRIAQQALDQKVDDAGRALFILGRAATLQKKIENALVYYERALQATKEPRITAWSHIYVARIQDLMCNRDLALNHYRAAQNSGDPGTDVKAAIERGLKEAPPNCKDDN